MKDKATILIVDDVPANIQTLAECLKEYYRIKVAIDGPRCLELLKNDMDVDLVLLDIEMPGMNGYEVCTHLKQNPLIEDIPVIFVTGNDQEEDEEKGLELGAVDYITKPIRPSIVLARVKTHITLKQQHDQLLAMAIHDQLTGIYNRHYLMDAASKKIARSIRHQVPLSLIMCDIDYFKKINDEYGHQFGDEVLKSAALLFNDQCRKEDIVTRFGGEEFVILFDHCDLNEAQIKAEKMRQSIEQMELVQTSVTVSFGVTQFQADNDDIELMIKRADMALYEAKAAGRNRVVVASDVNEIK